MKYFWLIICGTISQIFPRIDLYLCLNQDGQLGLIALPDLVISHTRAKLFYTSTNKDHILGAMLVSSLEESKDNSYLIPFFVTNEQHKKAGEIKNGYNSRSLGKILAEHNWKEFATEIIINNEHYLNDTSWRHALKRLCISDKQTFEEPDDFQESPGFNKKVPVFLYTSPDDTLTFTREQLNRDISIRKLISDTNFDNVVESLQRINYLNSLPRDHPFIYAINRAETEIQINYERQRLSMVKILLDPNLSVFEFDPSPKFKLTSRGKEVAKIINDQDVKSGFSIVNWEEPNIAQITLHVFTAANTSLKDSAISPAITIFSDEMGIHTLPTEIFRIDAKIFSLDDMAEGPIVIDELEPPQIPEVNLGPMSDLSCDKWWQTDSIAEKVLWLVTHYFYMRTLEKPEYLLFSITPILDDTIQIAVLFENVEEGYPYAFAIIRDDIMIKAIPIFTSDLYKVNRDGSITTQKMHSGKNYAISREGKRINDPLETIEFAKPIYSPIISDKYKEPKFYYSKNAIDDLHQRKYIKEQINLALGIWKMGTKIKGGNPFVILSFVDGSVEVIVVEMEVAIENAKSAARQLFNLNNPTELSTRIPLDSIKQYNGLNHTNLKKQNEIPWSAMMPRGDDKIYLCYEAVEEYLHLGILLNKNKPALAKVKKDKKQQSFITDTITGVCKSYLVYEPLPGNFALILNQLIYSVRFDNLSLTIGNSGELHCF